MSERRLVGAVPETARTGKLTICERYGNSATTPWRLHVAAAEEPPAVDVASSSRFFIDARRKPSFAFDAPQAMAVNVELSNVDTGELVRSWTVQTAPGITSRVVWGGRNASGVVTPGNFAFRIAGDAAVAGARAAGAPTHFAYADHIFPIRGRHNLGYSDTDNFGGGRGHQGQDMFARCGTPLAAARGGRVQYTGYHSAAGTTPSSTARRRKPTTSTCTCSNRRWWGPANGFSPARRSARCGRPDARRAATSTSRCGRRLGGRKAARRSTRCRRSRVGTATADMTHACWRAGFSYTSSGGTLS